MFLKNKKDKQIIKDKVGVSSKKSFSLQKLLTYSSILSSMLLPLFYLLSIYTVTNSCAQQQQLSGGPRDTFPPNLITELSTPNFQTNFEKKDIQLVFDEYIELRDVVKQVVVSPPLQYLPKVKRIKGFKTAKFQFNEEEVLKEGVTYAINFGESIKDLTEGNEVENLQFLFSTGDYIDSLEMSGTITDVLTGDPIPDALFMLYENFADTVVRTEKPYYFGKADKDGNFTIKYLKAGVFKGFALEDQDLNYLFNIPKERIGFTLDSIIINDSTETTIQIQLFEENTTLGKPKVDLSTYGLVKMGFKQPPYDAIINYDVIGQELYKETEGDTIRYWYNLQDSVDWNFYFQRDTLVDTFQVRALARNIKPLALARERSADAEIPLNPFKPLPLTFNHPIKNLDTSLVNFRKLIIQQPAVDSTINDSTAVGITDTVDAEVEEKPVRVIITDSTAIIREDTVDAEVSTTNDTTQAAAVTQKGPRLAANYTIDSLIKRTLIINQEWEENANYQLEILPGAIIDWYDEPNVDTILLNYVVKPKNDFGTINLTATEMDSTKSYWFQLLLGENVVKAFPVKNQKTYKEAFSALLPGKYSLKVVEDLDGNNRWSTGNYDKKLQPERISTANIEELRAGWDVEAEVKVNFENKEPETAEPTKDSN